MPPWCILLEENALKMFGPKGSRVINEMCLIR